MVVPLHADPTEKANILNRQFQLAFSSEANTEIPDKGPSTHPIMTKTSQFPKRHTETHQQHQPQKKL
jgi:hypothetical protein